MSLPDTLLSLLTARAFTALAAGAVTGFAICLVVFRAWRSHGN